MGEAAGNSNPPADVTDADRDVDIGCDGDSPSIWSAPASVRLSPLYPNQSATTEFIGSLGTTGATAGVLPSSMTSGS